MCLDDQILNTYLDGELKEPWKSQVEEHMSYCTGCSRKYEQLKELSKTVRESALTQEEIQSHQDRVLSIIEKNHINKHKKFAFLRKQFKLSVQQVMGVAAAFVIVFVGSFSIVSNRADNVISMPEVSSSIDISNITPVKAQNVDSSKKSLDGFTLEEIIKNLDSRGYDVDIRLKGIHPIEAETEIQEILPEETVDPVPEIVQ